MHPWRFSRAGTMRHSTNLTSAFTYTTSTIKARMPSSLSVLTRIQSRLISGLYID